MSKSKKRDSNASNANTQRSAVPPTSKPSWLLWAGLGVVGVLAIVALLAWQNGRNAEPGATNTGGTPNLQVDQTSIDFGDVTVDQMVKASFKLSNTGDGLLEVAVPDVPEVVEGC
ncbi:MAG: hypothetical protein KDI12_04885 [Anaerolineae bacterium]|nr:hypothetical protein [Anaerolineae bacterium]MCO5246491.1 DUF1573 domain-containing protein [Anaerolineae bacterium]